MEKNFIGLNEHTVLNDSIAQPVERWTGVPEGASSDSARVNSFSVDVVIIFYLIYLIGYACILGLSL